MIDVREADRILLDHTPLAPVCDCGLAEAVGRVLREDLRTDRDGPPFHRVTMDGIALSSAAVAGGRRAFRRQGVQAAGEPPRSLASPDSCIEVMTGGVLPEGCDTVVRIEDVDVEGDTATLKDEVTPRPMQNVHPKGSDVREGEVVVAQGTRLTPAHVGVAASVGAATLRVSVRPRIALVSTGDELVEVGVRPADHEVRQANTHALAAALGSYGYGEPVTRHLRDDPSLLASELGRLLTDVDVLVLSGGVSMGRFDFVPGVLRDLGVEPHLHRVRQRPGKPLWFGTRGRVAAFGLPGNPVSALTCLVRYVLPFLDRSAGATRPRVGRVRLSQDVRGLAGLARFVPVALREEDGAAREVAFNTSGDLFSVSRSDGFVEVAEGVDVVPAGTALPFFRWAHGP